MDHQVLNEPAVTTTWTFESVEHFIMVIGGIGAILGIVKMLRAWRMARDEGVVARAKQVELLRQLSIDIKEHFRASKEVAATNAREHADLHRRIDGLYELLGCYPATRKTAERHRAAAEATTTGEVQDEQ